MPIKCNLSQGMRGYMSIDHNTQGKRPAGPEGPSLKTRIIATCATVGTVALGGFVAYSLWYHPQQEKKHYQHQETNIKLAGYLHDLTLSGGITGNGSDGIALEEGKGSPTGVVAVLRACPKRVTFSVVDLDTHASYDDPNSPDPTEAIHLVPQLTQKGGDLVNNETGAVLNRGKSEHFGQPIYNAKQLSRFMAQVAVHDHVENICSATSTQHASTSPATS